MNHRVELMCLVVGMSFVFPTYSTYMYSTCTNVQYTAESNAFGDIMINDAESGAY